MLLDKYTSVKIVGANKAHYISKGYKLPYGIKYFVDVETKDLPTTSNIKVRVSCDDCGEERVTKFYRAELLCRSCAKKDCTFTDEHKAKISKAKKGQNAGENNHFYGKVYKFPSEHPSYNHNLSDKDRADRRINREYREWQYDVKKNDNFTCQSCYDSKGGNLVSHHLESHNSNIDLRYDIDNGVCLCETCHKEFHGKFGYGNNTSEQFEEYIELKGVSNG